MNNLLITSNNLRYNLMSKAKSKFDNAIVKFDGWFLVLLAVLMTLAFTISAALVIWCMVYKGKKFTFNWRWSLRGVSVNAECK